MISAQDRREAIELLNEAVSVGARQTRACALLGLSARTVQRWRGEDGVGQDRRPRAERPTPPNAHQRCRAWRGPRHLPPS